MNLWPQSPAVSAGPAAIPPDFNLSSFQEASCCHHA